MKTCVVQWSVAMGIRDVDLSVALDQLESQTRSVNGGEGECSQ